MTIWAKEIKELETLYTSIKGRFPELEKELEHFIRAMMKVSLFSIYKFRPV